MVPAGPTRMLVLQATPGCNIDCAYCYLPGRTARTSMAAATMQAAVQALHADHLLGRQLIIGWHAGEPLMLPPDYFARAFRVLSDAAGSRLELRHHLQTNAVAATDAHAEVLAAGAVRVGVSLDGPADLHDARRRTRTATGTHALTVRGLERLQRRGLSPHVISVVTAGTLAHGRRLVEHLHGLGVDRVALNFEETEGGNRSSLAAVAPGRVHTFLTEVRETAAALGVRVREFETMEALLNGATPSDDLVRPFAIVSVDWEGGFSTFSPELLAWTHARYGAFVLGNVHRDRIREAAALPAFQRMHADVRAGVARCRRRCPHFARCGGGAPSNKLAEHGTFAADLTLACRLRHQAVASVVGAGQSRSTTPA